MLPICKSPSSSLRKAPIWGLLLLLVCCAAVFPAEPSKATLESEILRIISQTKLAGAFWGIDIVDLESNTPLFSLNPQKFFTPASTQKLVTVAAALDQLGPDFHYETAVYQDGRIEAGGILKGNLVLVGAGDPNLAGRKYLPDEKKAQEEEYPAVLRFLARQIGQHGLKRIDGNLVVDDTEFVYEPLGTGWEWDDLTWYYAAPVSTLAVNGNSFALEVSPGAEEGQPATLKAKPQFEGLKLINQTRTGPRGAASAIHMSRALEREDVTVWGEIALKSAPLVEKVAVHDPATYAGLALKAALEQEGISVQGQVAVRHVPITDVPANGEFSVTLARQLRPRYAPGNQLAAYQSLPLSDSLKVVMKESDNLGAEMLFRKLGAINSGIGSIESGRKEVRKFLVKASIAPDSIRVVDGCGMSKSNLVTPEAIVKLLLYMNTQPQAAAFKDLLPVAGMDGTLKNRMTTAPARGRIFAKTGTLEGSYALAGYATAINGRRFAFSIMVNNQPPQTPEVRQAMDEICALMAGLDAAP